jgi:hypothetical protein
MVCEAHAHASVLGFLDWPLAQGQRRVSDCNGACSEAYNAPHLVVFIQRVFIQRSAAAQAALERCIVHDLSYWCPFRLIGDRAAIRSALAPFEVKEHRLQVCVLCSWFHF